MLQTTKKAFSLLTRAERRRVVPLVFMMLVGAVLESLSVTMVIPIVAGFMDVDRMVDGPFGAFIGKFVTFADPRGYLGVLIVAMVLLFIAKNAFLLWTTYAQHRFTSSVYERVHNGLLSYFLMKPYEFFLGTDSGKILQVVTIDSDNYSKLLNHVLRILTDALVTVSVLAVVLVVSPRITVMLGCVMAVEYLIILRFIKPFLREYGLRYRQAVGEGNGQIIEIMRGMKSVKVSSTEGFFAHRYADKVREIAKAKFIENAFTEAPKRLVEAMTVSALLLYLLGILAVGGDLAGLIPVLSAFILAATRVLPSIGSISNSVSHMGYHEASLERVYSIFRELEKRGSNEDAHGVLPFARSIDFVDVTYSYPDAQAPVIDRASIQIPKYSVLGIVGPSGVGKTTFVDVLLGLLNPQEGIVLVDGEPVETSSSNWKRLFAYIPQDIFMLNGTIWDNVVFGRDVDRNDPRVCKEVWEAIEAAQLSEFVGSLKHGLDSEIGEAGVRLSGGQAQRIAIARALYANASVLVFDEATSALDYRTEEMLMESIEKLKGSKTIVIVAHRMRTLRGCDLVYRIEGGKIAHVNKEEILQD